MTINAIPDVVYFNFTFTVFIEKYLNGWNCHTISNKLLNNEWVIKYWWNPNVHSNW